MFRNDVVMTPLRVKQAIDSRFVKPSEDELNVLIGGKWVGFGKLPPHVNCTELLTMYKGDATLIETPIINAENCTHLDEVFKNCTNLKRVGYIHMPNVRQMINTFVNCTSLTDLPQLDTSNVIYMGSMLYGCSSLTEIPQLDTSNVASMINLFRRCSVLTSVTFQCNDVRPYGTDMFYGTPIASGNGYIFVPDELVNEYKTAPGWSDHASVIFGHSDKENMTLQVQQMTTMNIENKPSKEELQLMMQEFEDEELM